MSSKCSEEIGRDDCGSKGKRKENYPGRTKRRRGERSELGRRHLKQAFMHITSLKMNK